MSEWWTYRPSDFLMFSAGSHAGLLEQYNRDSWPWHAAMLVAGLWLLAAAAAPSPRFARRGTLVLAVLWVWVGWAFLWNRFAEINLAARYLAVACGVQAALLAVFARTAPGAGASSSWRIVGAGVIAAAVLLWPWTAPLTGRTWLQAESFGMTLEPTALATIGWLVATRPRQLQWLAPIPTAALLVGITMLWLLYLPGNGGSSG